MAPEPESRDENGRAFRAEGAAGPQAGAVLCKWVVGCRVGEGTDLRRWPRHGGTAPRTEDRVLCLIGQRSGATEHQGLERRTPSVPAPKGRSLLAFGKPLVNTRALPPHPYKLLHDTLHHNSP